MLETGSVGSIEKKAGKRTFLRYIHAFRGVAILFVVGGHILLNWKPDMFSETILNAIFRNGTVLFVFIAGYLFQHLSGKFETIDYWKKKVLYVLIPYVLISFPALVLRFIETPRIVLLENPDYGNWSAIHKIFYYLTTGAHLQPLWFVPMITLFYLAAPLFIRADRSGWLYKLLPVFIIVSVLVPRDALSDIPRMFVHFFSVYVFGMFFSRFKEEISRFSAKWWPYLTLLTGIFTVLTFMKSPYADTLMYGQKMLFCWFFIYWLSQVEDYLPKFLDVLADISFGIFFLHYYFLLSFKFLSERYAPSFMDGNVLNWLIHFVLIVTFNSLFLIIVKNVFQTRSRYLVGS